jgi:hypothetical protein
MMLLASEISGLVAQWILLHDDSGVQLPEVQMIFSSPPGELKILNLSLIVRRTFTNLFSWSIRVEEAVLTRWATLTKRELSVKEV